MISGDKTFRYLFSLSITLMGFFALFESSEIGVIEFLGRWSGLNHINLIYGWVFIVFGLCVLVVTGRTERLILTTPLIFHTGITYIVVIENQAGTANATPVLYTMACVGAWLWATNARGRP